MENKNRIERLTRVWNRMYVLREKRRATMGWMVEKDLNPDSRGFARQRAIARGLSDRMLTVDNALVALYEVER